ncbi:MAG TPA: RagB/SusD family nutrient uptake outer membrane protein [Puia sp.]|nr:RagB/SusD family nutrient uptake outer membrane protein [Puia sp.]
MKYLFPRAISFSLIILLAMGCSKNYLDRNNPATLTYSDIYNTPDDFEAALAGCYQSIQGPSTTNIFIGDLPSDNVYVSRFQPTGDLTDFDDLNYNAQDGTLDTYWANNYTTIERVNLLINKMTNSGIDSTQRLRITAEAEFLRAYSYFNLVRVFGGVPLYEKPTDINTVFSVPRSAPKDVLNFAVSDLQAAENVDSYRTPAQLASTGGRATTMAAKTLLGKVYLWEKDFKDAETTLADIVSNSGSYGLEKDLSALYSPENPNDKEIIFSVNYERAAGFGSPFVNAFIPYDAPPSLGIYPNITVLDGSGDGMIEPYVAAKFSPGDKRAALMDTAVFSVLSTVDTNIYSTKYIDPQTTFNYLSGSNTIILRYADVLLMYAEALNEDGKTAQAYQYINMVRERAGIADLPGGYSHDQMFQALADERQKEFLLEGDRWFDLRYRGMPFLEQTMNNFKPNAYLTRDQNIQVTDNLLLFPIPADQILLKPSVLTQNPGY